MVERFRKSRRGGSNQSPPPDGGVAIGRFVGDFLQGLKVRASGAPTGIEDAWPSLVGSAAAVHTRPGRFVKGELVVFVDNSVWLSELQRYSKTDILERIQQRFGKERVQGLRFQLAPDE
jgi:hypothetical protein